MTRRRIPRKRILIVLGIGALLAAGAAGAYYARRWEIDRRAVAAREGAVEALAKGDNAAALDGMGAYIRRFGDRGTTSRDWAVYAKARVSLPASNGAHVADAIAAYRKAIDLDPSARSVQADLLELYSGKGYFAEALSLADEMLRTEPTDVGLLRKRADVLEVLRRFQEALDAAKAICAQPNPTREDLFRVCRLMVRGAMPENEVDLWLDATAAVRPNDPFVDLVRAIVRSTRGDAAGANVLIDRVVASSETSNDAELRIYLLKALDETHRFSDAVAVMRRMSDVTDLTLRREIVRRMWYAGDPIEALARTTTWYPDPKSAEPEMLAIRALALRWLGRSPDAAPLRTELASRTDPAAKAWSSLVEMDRPDGVIPPAEAVRILTQAVAAIPDTGLFLCALGDARAATGELDAAVRTWIAAARSAPSWYLPHARLASAYRTSQQPARALEAARAAVERSPQSLDAMTVWVEVNADAAASLDPEHAAVFLRQLATAQTAVPKLADVVLPVRVSLLVRTDQIAAKALIAELLASPAGASEGALLRIAATAARARLGSVDPILARCEELHGVTPRLAMTTAVLQGRGPDAGLAAFDAMRARAGSGGTAAEWDVARAGLLEAVGRPEAAAAWGSVADANPASVAIQLAALSAKSMWTDPKAVARAADRLKELTGENGVMWRLSRARLLLQAPDATDKDAAEAAEILTSVVRDAPDNVHAHILLSRALQLTGDAAGIEAHLQEALRLAPGNTSIALDLARVAQSRGDAEEARRRIETVLAAKSVAPQEAEGAAYILAAQGDLQRSAELLQRLVREHRADASATLELSRLYARAGRVDEAIRLSEGLLDAPTAQVVEHTAGLYASVGRTADSDRLIRALDTLQLPAGEADLVRARYAARWGTPGAATAAYRAAVAAAPARADAWAAFAEHAVAIGDKSVLSEALDDPRAAAADPIVFARSIRALCDFALVDPGLRQLLLGAMRDPAQRPAVTAALRAIAQDWPDPAKRASTAKTVRALAEANVKFAVLQMVAVDLCAQTTERNSALEFSRRTAAAFPNNAEAAHQWAELLASAGRWSEALDAARTWRDRADPRDAAPDELIARMLLRLGRDKEAAVALAPRVAAALARPQTDEAVLVTHAVTLLRTGDMEALRRLLRQLSATSDRWRTLPLSVGPDFLGTPAEAVAWLRVCAELAPQDDTTTRIFLAQAWIVAWKSLRTPELLAESKRLLAEILASPQPPATGHFLAGTLAEASGDTAAAEAAYGAALRANPEFVQARNNLAMLLADGGRWQDAVDHARRVVAASPRSPQALDTLAHALRVGEKFDEARTRIGEAILLDPVNPAWQVELAETLADARDTDALTAVLETIRSMEEDGVVLSKGLKERIERVRQRPK